MYSFMSSTITRGLFGYASRTSKRLLLTVAQLLRAAVADAFGWWVEVVAVYYYVEVAVV